MAKLHSGHLVSPGIGTFPIADPGGKGTILRPYKNRSDQGGANPSFHGSANGLLPHTLSICGSNECIQTFGASF